MLRNTQVYITISKNSNEGKKLPSSHKLKQASRTPTISSSPSLTKTVSICVTSMGVVMVPTSLCFIQYFPHFLWYRFFRDPFDGYRERRNEISNVTCKLARFAFLNQQQWILNLCNYSKLHIPFYDTNASKKSIKM